MQIAEHIRCQRSGSPPEEEESPAEREDGRGGFKMRKTEAMAEATSKKQEASSDLGSNRTGSSHAALPFGGATVNFVKCSISKKSIGGSPTLHRRKPRCS